MPYARREAIREFIQRVTFAGAILLSLVVGLPRFSPPLSAAEPTSTSVAVAPAAVAPMAALQQHLKQVFAGENPAGVADLKAMQSHVQKLTAKLIECTVGVQVGAAQGSGVLISKDGYVLTAAHVAGTPNKDVIFLFPDGRMMRGKTLGLNRTMDAGLMKINEPDETFPFVEMGVSEGLQLGQWCLATGHPGGYQADRQPVLRLGRIVFLDNSAVTTDCTLVGGDSGGPLFNMDGKVIGINSRISGPLTANMHVPVDAFKTNWERLMKGDAWGHYPGQEPFIGVRGEANVKEAKVAHVYSGSPAEKAGLKAGDLILAVDGAELPDFASLSAAVSDHQPGDRIRLKVQRGEEELSLRLVIGKRGES
jgi:serine protease Do